MSWPVNLATTQDLDEANLQDYLAWKEQHHKHRWQSITLFNMYQCRNIQRMCSQAKYKDEAQRESETLKDVIERRISNACDCPICEAQTAAAAADHQQQPKIRRNSDLSMLSRDSSRGSDTSLHNMSSAPETASPTRAIPSSRNSLITSPPPRSRHHRRRANSIPH